MNLVRAFVSPIYFLEMVGQKVLYGVEGKEFGFFFLVRSEGESESKSFGSKPST